MMITLFLRTMIGKYFHFRKDSKRFGSGDQLRHLSDVT